MSKDWTQEELQQISRVMKAAGHMGYEEFCEFLEKGLTAFCKVSDERFAKMTATYEQEQKTLEGRVLEL